MIIDLKKIANTPGYGVGSRELRAAGEWDEFATSDGDPKTFTAFVSASMPCTAIVTVTARCEEEAKQMIHDKVSGQMFHDWDWSDGAEDIDVYFSAPRT